MTSSDHPTTTNPSSHKPLTAKELHSHPAFNSNEWNLSPTTSGNCIVAKTRSGGPFKLFYEIHGSGPCHIVWIMGLGAFRTAWKRQSKFFGHGDRASQYSCLVFDNRGVGLSDKPTARYSTSEMALDIIDLLHHVGWLDDNAIKRDLNIAGVSMGGMIAQEVGLLIPDHIQSLMLISTAPRLIRTTPFIENLRQRINMFIPRDIDTQLNDVALRLFSAEFLAQPDTENQGDASKTFPTNQDRFSASELAKRMDKEGFTRKGFILQAIAAGWHFKSDEQLRLLADRVGRKRIMVMHGGKDRMITMVPHLDVFKNAFAGGQGRNSTGDDVEYRVWDGSGHVLAWECEDEFNKEVEEFLRRTNEMNGLK